MKSVYRVSLLLLGSCIASACAVTHSHDSETDALQVVRIKFDAFNRHDMAALQHIYADDGVLQAQSTPIWPAIRR